LLNLSIIRGRKNAARRERTPAPPQAYAFFEHKSTVDIGPRGAREKGDFVNADHKTALLRCNILPQFAAKGRVCRGLEVT
jgi:hypothetical protein